MLDVYLSAGCHYICSQLRLCQYKEASATCCTVLERDTDNVKALYRRALASRELSRLASERCAP